jgi:Outer membrane protein/protective antigen OMA87
VFSTTNPYFTADGISRTLDVYYRTDKPYEDQGGNYQLVTTGTSVRFGVPFSETDTVFLVVVWSKPRSSRAPTFPPPTCTTPTSLATPALPFP